MASIGDVFLRLLLDDADFEKNVVARAQKAGDKAGLSMGQNIAAGISKGATQIGQTLASVGQNLTKTGRSMTTNLTLPILAAGGAATKFALDFDTSLRQISGLTDVTGEELDGIREKILAMGPAVGKGPQELAEAFYFIASAGFKADEAMEVLEVSAKASAAGMGETQVVAKALAGVINAYGHENLDAATAGDILTAAVKKGSAEASDFAGVIGQIAPLAAALGVSMDQFTAALAGMTNVGISADEATTSLVAIFSALLKTTPQAEEAMKGLGLSSEGLRRQLREEGLLATLRTLEERFAGNETASSAVFGNIRALRGITALLSLDTAQLNDVFAGTADHLGQLQQAYDDTEGPQRELDRAMSDLQATAIELGADVLPMVVDIIKQVAGAARELGKWWRSLSDDQKKSIVQWLAWIAVAGPVLLLAGKLVTGLGGLFRVVGFLAGPKGIPALVGGMSKARLLMLGWVGVIAAVAFGLNEVADDVGFFFDELIKGKKATNTLKELQKLTGDMMKAQVLREWGVSVEEFTQVLERAEGDVDAAFNAIKDNAGDVGKALHDLSVDADPANLFTGWGTRDPTKIRQALDDAKAAGDDLPEELSASLEDGQFVVGPAAEVMVDPIQEALTAAKEDAAKKATEIVEALVGGLTDDREAFRQQVQDFLDDITSPYSDLTRKLDIEGALASDALMTGLHSSDSQDQADTATFIQGLISQYEQLEPGAMAAGELVNPALQAGINRNLDALVTWLQQTTMPSITDPFDIADQLDLMGYEGLAGYVRGLERARLDKIATATGLIRRDTKAGMLINLETEGYNSGVSYADGLESAEGYLTKKVQKFGGKVKNLLAVMSEPKDPDSPLRGITKWGGNLVGTIADGMLRAVPDMARAASAVGMAMLPRGGMMQHSMASIPSAAGMFNAATPTAAGPSVVNNTWNLTVNGVSYPFRTRDDFIKALDDMAGFNGDGRLKGG